MIYVIIWYIIGLISTIIFYEYTCRMYFKLTKNDKYLLYTDKLRHKAPLYAVVAISGGLFFVLLLYLHFAILPHYKAVKKSKGKIIKMQDILNDN